MTTPNFRQIYPKTPKFTTGLLTTANTNLDGTGTLVTMMTIGAAGGEIQQVDALSVASVATDTVIRAFVSTDNGSTKVLFREWQYLLDNITVAVARAAQEYVTRADEDEKIVLPASAIVYISTTKTVTGIRVNMQHMDY